MDAWIEILKALAGLGGAAITAAKLFFSGGEASRDRKFDERRERVKAFLAAYDERAHPILIEASFAAAMGHTKISAFELPILLRQRKPTQFIDLYAKVQDYLQPNECGTELELRSLAARAWLRNLLTWGGLAVYFAMAISTAVFGLYVLPDAVQASDWAKALSAMFNTFLFAGSALVVLIASGRLHWAAKLHDGQIRASEPTIAQPSPA